MRWRNGTFSQCRRTEFGGNTMTIPARHSHSLFAMALLVLCAVLALSACGGGKSALAPQAGEAAAFNWTHEAARVRDAHDRVRSRYGADVLPGEGVSVAIIDTGNFGTIKWVFLSTCFSDSSFR